MSAISYAQNYEDVMLWRALKDVQDGFYVDVGANDPVVDSVTCWFYQQGWRGMNIEPVPYWHERLQAGRPLDINLQVAVSTEAGFQILYDVPHTGLSTLSSQVAMAHQREGMPVVEIRVAVVPLEDLLTQHVGDREIHFLKIDVEGAEREVLQGVALTRIRPWIILVEATEPRDPTPNHHQWEDLLTTRGYRFAYFDGLNRFYVAIERSNLLEALKTPPNTFDAFMRYAEWQLRSAVRELQDQLHQVRSEQSLLENEKARSDRAHLELSKDHQLLTQIRADLEQSQHELRQQYQLLLQEHAVLEQSNQALRQEHQSLLQEQQALLQEHAALEQAQNEWSNERRNLVQNAEELAQQIGRVQQEHQHLIDEHALLMHANDQLQTLHKRNTQEIQAHLQRIHDLTHSTSWRITGPLRRIGSWVKKPSPGPVPLEVPGQSLPLQPVATLEQASGALPDGPKPSPDIGASPTQLASANDLLLQNITLHWRLVDRLDASQKESKAIRCALCDHTGPENSFKVYQSQCRFGGGHLHRYQCPECDVIFGPMKMFRLHPDELSQEYDWHYRLFTEGDSTEQEIRAFEALNPVQGGTYLNYGAGAWSSSVRQLREKGWNVIAYEPTESAQTESGLITQREVLSSMRFDGIFSNNVLEHLPDPVQDLRFLASLLQPGARMSHATPCFEYLYEYTRFHLFFYLGRSRQVLANRAHLNICSFQQDGHYMNAVYEPLGCGGT